MDASTLTLFVPACLALNMAPGPNNLLSLSNATRFGFMRAFTAGGGRLVAFSVMIFLASAGLAVVLQTSAMLFTAIKVVGAAYLFWLAFQLWRSVPDSKSDAPQGTASLASLTRQEFLVAAGNPKAILIFTAFLPQFVNAAEPSAPQFVVLGALFLILEVVAMAAYAYMGVHMRRFFAEPRGQRIFHRSCATLLAGAGAGLLAARR